MLSNSDQDSIRSTQFDFITAKTFFDLVSAIHVLIVSLLGHAQIFSMLRHSLILSLLGHSLILPLLRPAVILLLWKQALILLLLRQSLISPLLRFVFVFVFTAVLFLIEKHISHSVLFHTEKHLSHYQKCYQTAGKPPYTNQMKTRISFINLKLTKIDIHFLLLESIVFNEVIIMLRYFLRACG